MAEKVLYGITWGHSRGVMPLLAISQRYNELYPDVEIRWQKRTLQEFADFPTEKLAADFDLLVIDHPCVGQAAAENFLLPLNEYLSKEYLQDQERNSAGLSHVSYNYNNHQWALAIDAATPAASYRKDLFEKNNCVLPTTWNDLLRLANEGKVAIPAIPIDLLMNFYTFCIAHGKEPFQNEHEVIEEHTALLAMETMKKLYSLIDKKMFNLNPIVIAEIMSTTDDYWYCPFAYCYSNYSRKGYSKNLLYYTGLVSFHGNELRSTLGGTGLAVSAFSKHKTIAVHFAEMVASGECQRTLYVQNGGQPGHRSAWLNEEANWIANNFFENILPVIDNSYVRPRYNGYLHFQDHAGIPLQKCLMEYISPKAALNEMNGIYQQSKTYKQLTATA
jgi:multiple sugar transport system substrate-binding protein